MTRGRKPTAAGAELASAVLSDLATGMSHAAIAELHGVSRQRVGAIAKAAGVTTRASRGGTAAHSGAALLARLRELAAAAGADPADWLEDAFTLKMIAEQIVIILCAQQETRRLSDIELTILYMIIDRQDPSINAKKVRERDDRR